jgi:hypothetical protein
LPRGLVEAWRRSRAAARSRPGARDRPCFLTGAGYACIGIAPARPERCEGLERREGARVVLFRVPCDTRRAVCAAGRFTQPAQTNLRTAHASRRSSAGFIGPGRAFRRAAWIAATSVSELLARRSLCRRGGVPKPPGTGLARAGRGHRTSSHRPRRPRAAPSRGGGGRNIVIDGRTCQGSEFVARMKPPVAPLVHRG